MDGWNYSITIHCHTLKARVFAALCIDDNSSEFYARLTFFPESV